MARDGFPFGILFFSDLNKCLAFLDCFQNLGYDIEVKDCVIFVYEHKEFYEMVNMCSSFVDPYIIWEINDGGAKYKKTA